MGEVGRMHVAMLDMGNRKYGDCTYCEIDGKRILIDGAHKGDEACSTRMPASLPDQLKELTGNDAPYDFDLIVITHCHSDHIGCIRSEEHTSELQSLMRKSYAVFCLKKKKQQNMIKTTQIQH